MNIFIYEFLTGGGCYALAKPPRSIPSLLSEGQAMVTALASDFASIENVQVSLLGDRRIGLEVEHGHVQQVTSAAEEQTCFAALAAEADWTVVIAPEFDNLLIQRCEWVRASGGRLLGPGAKTVALATNKQRTAEHLTARGLRTPQGIVVDEGEPVPADISYPAVLKPLDGAGSTNTDLLATPDEIEALGPVAFDARVEAYHPGLPVSVAVLCGPREQRTLMPCGQRIADDGEFTYLGGSLPLSADLTDRASSLASRAVATLPDALGYIGFDLLLGEQPSEDVILEINPRLTTSYVGLRAATDYNLAQAMLEIADGQTSDLRFQDRSVEFTTDGIVRTTIETAS